MIAYDRTTTSQAVLNLRKGLGDTLQQFATRLNCAYTTVARWETVRPPSGDSLLMLIAVAEKHGLDVDELRRVLEESSAVYRYAYDRGRSVVGLR